MNRKTELKSTFKYILFIIIKLSILMISILSFSSAYADYIIDNGDSQTIGSQGLDLFNQSIIVGDSTNGTLTLENGGVISDLSGYIGNKTGSQGTVNITGAGSTWKNSHQLIVGQNGNGLLSIDNGAAVTNTYGYIGNSVGNQGTVNITGAGSTWENNLLYVGQSGNGLLSIDNGAAVTNTSSYIGNSASGQGTVNITGAGSTWKNNRDLIVGQNGNGLLSIDNGAAVTSAYGYIGNKVGSQGTVNITGTDSIWENSLNLIVGQNGNGLLSIDNGGAVTSGSIYIANSASSMGQIRVSDSGSTISCSGNLYVGNKGVGELLIENSAVVSNAIGNIGYTKNTAGSKVTVTGKDSKWINTFSMWVGYDDDATLNILNGGFVSTPNSNIGGASADSTARGIINVSGLGSTWQSDSVTFEAGEINITDQAQVLSTRGSIGRSPTKIATVNISGTGSMWNVLGSDFSLGQTGNGILNLADGGVLSVDNGRGTLFISSFAGGSGTLNIGSASGNTPVAPGIIKVYGINLGPDLSTGTINFNHTDSSYQFDTWIYGNGMVNVLAGNTTFNNFNSYSGTTTIGNGATLQAGRVKALSAASDYVVDSGGRLAINGYDQTLASLTNNGSVILDNNTTVGTQLTIKGNYQGNNGKLFFNAVLGDDSSLTSKLIVNQDTSGTTQVSVNNLGGAGALTSNGIEIITVNGNSNGIFKKMENTRIVAGLYEYDLVKKNNNWYLMSELAPVIPPIDPEQLYRPESGSYMNNHLASNVLFITRLHDRLGETQYTDILTGEKKVTSMWMRHIGGHHRSRDGSGQLKTQSNRYVLQIGGDIAEWSNRWHLGLMTGYAHHHSNTQSAISGYDSIGSIKGYHGGMYTTWYANDNDQNGHYLDIWAIYSWFDNEVKGEYLRSEQYKSYGATASVEAGYTFKLGESESYLQPNAQAIWMNVRADNHTESNGTHVSANGNGNIQTRLGLRAYIKGHSNIDNDKDREFEPFVEANWLHNSRNFAVTMNGLDNKIQGIKNIGELKLGLESQLSKLLNLWGNVSQQIGGKGYSDTQIVLGAKYSF